MRPLCHAEDSAPLITLSADKTQSYLGDPIQLTLTLERPQSSEVKPPEIEKYLTGFKLKDLNVEERKLKGERISSIFTYVIIPLEVGTLNVGPLSLEYHTTLNQTEELKTNVVSIEVKSLINSQEQNPDIRGPKPLLQLKRNWFWAYAALALLILLGMGGWFVARKSRLSEGSPVPVGPILTADEVALKKLEELSRSSLLKEGKIKEVYSQLSDILREYLEKRYHFNCLEMTTYEALKFLKEEKFPSGLMEKLRELLNESDLVKFAKYIPEVSQFPLDIQKGKEIIEQTKEASHAP
ncbi:MAG: hypothetical protein HYS08_05500 [Chlamydiae bacterium]|nr:hypothetical protein [Chlamydiota bacterium]MBI3267172.1 hypothetical protein [Chlamydiota bacterium]